MKIRTLLAAGALMLAVLTTTAAYAIDYAQMVRRYVLTVKAWLEAEDEREEMRLADVLAASPLPDRLKEAILDAMRGVRDAAWDAGRKSDD